MPKANDASWLGAWSHRLLCAAVVLTLCTGCQKPAAPAMPAPTQVSAPATHVLAVDPSSASSLPASTVPAHPAFDAQRAFTLLREQVDFGPRYLGSAAHQKTLDFLLAEMRKYADETVTQKMTYRGMTVTNVVGVFYPAGAKTPSKHPVLLMAHWDTRPIADGPYSSETQQGAFTYGPNGWNRLAPIPGADDGASGVAVLLELARLFKQKPPPVGVLLLLDDGEDYGDFRANNDAGDGVVLGARYFAAHYQDDSRFGHPAYGILLDMVGGKGMTLLPEAFSKQYARTTNEKVFGIANTLGYGDIFVQSGEQSVDDDHLPLNEIGHIPTIDLIQPLPGAGIQNAYMQWHTLQDDVAHCDPKSLKAVGDTIAEVIYEEAPEP